MRTKRVGLAMAVLGLMAIGAGRAEADLIVDQEQTYSNSTGSAESSIGQSFTPTATSMDTIEFKLFSEGSTVLHLAILDGVVGTDGLEGAVLATSAAVTLTNGTIAPIDFQLTSPLTVVPGDTYVAELVFQSGSFFHWAQEQGSNLYAGGQMLQAGLSPSSVIANKDYEFREGLTATSTPEPSNLIFGALAGLAGIGYAWRRRRMMAVA